MVLEGEPPGEFVHGSEACARAVGMCPGMFGGTVTNVCVWPWRSARVLAVPIGPGEGVTAHGAQTITFDDV